MRHLIHGGKVNLQVDGRALLVDPWLNNSNRTSVTFQLGESVLKRVNELHLMLLDR